MLSPAATSTVPVATSAETATITAAPIPATNQNALDGPPTTTLTIATPSSVDVDSVLTSPQCDRTSTSHIGLLCHLLIHRAVTDTPIPGAPTHTRHIHLHCPRTFVHLTGLFGHMRKRGSTIVADNALPVHSTAG
nr:unnamed protein product [Spirometra erinaceieuropaei]